MKNDLPERTFTFAIQVVNLCRLLDEKQGVPRTLANQLLRSGNLLGPMFKKVRRARAKLIFFLNIV